MQTSAPSLTPTHSLFGGGALCNACSERGTEGLSALRHRPPVAEVPRSGADSAQRFEVAPGPAFEPRTRPASWPAVIKISPASIFKGSMQSKEHGAHTSISKGPCRPL